MFSHVQKKKAASETKVEKMKLRSEDLTPKCLQGQSSIVALTKSFSKWLVVLGTPSSLVLIFEKLLLITSLKTFQIRNFFMCIGKLLFCNMTSIDNEGFFECKKIL